MSRIIWLIGLAVLAATVSGPTSASDKALKELYTGHKLRAQIIPAPGGKVMMTIDGRPQPLFWADLCDWTDPRYRRAGFNTVHLILGHGDGSAPLEKSFESWDKSLLDIKRRGLYVIIFIHNSVLESAAERPGVPDDKWKKYVQTIIRRYRGVTNLVGWNFCDEMGDVIPTDGSDFQSYLAGDYGSIGNLNRSWRTSYRAFEDIKLEYQRGGKGRPEESMRQPEFPFGVGPKAFDSARFKLSRIHYSLKQFEAAVREVDKSTPMWTGAHNLGWPATQIPTGWGCHFDFYPQFSGNDFDTHHVWMVDVGRGGNTRAALPMMMVEHSESYNWHLDARVLRSWMIEGAFHGASGATFWPWSFLAIDARAGDRSTRTERVDMLGTTIRALESSGIFSMRPEPTIAVMYQPYAEGWGNMSQVYGLLREPTGEPLPLMEALKFGTKYGQADYLTPQDIERVDLDRYGVVLAPFSADIPSEQMASLTRYVENGGVLFTDVGFGCIQAGKTVIGMTDAAKRLFGLSDLRVSSDKPGNYVATGEFPGFLRGIAKGDSTQVYCKFTVDATPTTAVAALKGPGGQGLYVNRLGEGYAVFCTALGWADSVAGEPVLRKLHNALFSRRAKIEMVEPSGDAGQHGVHFAENCEIAAFAQGYAVQNRGNVEREIGVRVGNQTRKHTLSPYTAVVVKGDEVIPLGIAAWPVELGPKSEPEK